MKTDAYLITCLTNLHVGSGESNYGVVDNLVQRDPINQIPIIHSSSLKGALREYFKDIWGENNDKLNYVFGPDSQRNNNSTTGIGNYKFFDANMIVLPVRSDKEPFFRATSEFLLKDIIDKASALGISNLNLIPYTNTSTNNQYPKVTPNYDGCYLEDWKGIGNLVVNQETNLLGERLALFDSDTFKELAKHLPVIARNQLDNGESKNLWYEEVVPRESRFVFFVSKTEDYNIVSESDFDTAFNNNKVVQIGGNASIGYGYCKINKISG